MWRTSANITWSQRWGHTSWTTGEGTHLMAGGKFDSHAILVRPGGKVQQAFNMAESAKYADLTLIFKLLVLIEFSYHCTM